MNVSSLWLHHCICYLGDVFCGCLLLWSMACLYYFFHIVVHSNDPVSSLSWGSGSLMPPFVSGILWLGMSFKYL